jgi:metal-responsive CopG/Arc/MetJ family transcriptional regulator
MGHTKVAVSLPNELFEQLVEAAREEATTRSALVAHALQNYFERKSAAEIVARLNQVYSGPWTEEEDREEQSLARMRRNAARRMSAMLREQEEVPWPTGT